MEKILICSFLFLVSLPIYALDTNYRSVQECINEVEGYASAASKKDQSDLSKWFYSFANDTQMQVNYSNGTVIIYNGCHFVGSNEVTEQLWKKMQEKLNQQIYRHNSGQNSLYGEKATLICNYSEVTRQIDVNSCR